jgi:hypothetical protein
VALLISGQADYVNTYFYSSIDNPNPSTHAGPLTVAGLLPRSADTGSTATGGTACVICSGCSKRIPRRPAR